jgi:hypothetical protein
MSVKLADTVVVKTTDVAGLSVCVKKATTAGGGKLAGRIVTPDGKPISGVVVTAQSVNDLRSFAISDANGQYEITDLDAAIYTVTAEKVGFISTQTGIATIDYSRGMFESQINFQMTVQGATSVRSSVVSIPAEFKLNQNYPNPFNPSTEIRFSVPNDGKATLKVYNLIGQVVATLLDGSVKAGEHSAKFDTNTNEIPSGVYLYELRFEGMRLVNKMVLMK